MGTVLGVTTATTSTPTPQKGFFGQPRLFFTIAELLLLSPVGLSVSTKLAPAKFHTQMVALFFLAVAMGTAMSGLLSGYYDAKGEVPYFSWLDIVVIAGGIVLWLFVKPINKLMGRVR